MPGTDLCELHAGKSVLPPKLAGLVPYRYQPGSDGNLSGRPRALDRYIRAQTSDVIEIADFYLGLFRDESAKLDTRITAANWLTDRSLGTAVQMSEGQERRLVEIRVIYDTAPGPTGPMTATITSTKPRSEAAQASTEAVILKP